MWSETRCSTIKEAHAIKTIASTSTVVCILCVDARYIAIWAMNASPWPCSTGSLTKFCLHLYTSNSNHNNNIFFRLLSKNCEQLTQWSMKVSHVIKFANWAKFSFFFTTSKYTHMTISHWKRLRIEKAWVNE